MKNKIGTILFILLFNQVYSQVGKVGINTPNPQATLDVQGNMILGTAPSTTGGTGFSTVVRDNTTGELKVSASSTGNTTPITVIQYNLSNVYQDWISNYDTKISATDYNLVIVGSSFSSNLTVLGNGPYYYSPYVAIAFVQDGTWRISADYNGTTTQNSANGNWQLVCMAINKSISKTLPAINQNLGGNHVASAATPPAGL